MQTRIIACVLEDILHQTQRINMKIKFVVFPYLVIYIIVTITNTLKHLNNITIDLNTCPVRLIFWPLPTASSTAKVRHTLVEKSLEMLLSIKYGLFPKISVCCIHYYPSFRVRPMVSAVCLSIFSCLKISISEVQNRECIHSSEEQFIQ